MWTLDLSYVRRVLLKKFTWRLESTVNRRLCWGQFCASGRVKVERKGGSHQNACNGTCIEVMDRYNGPRSLLAIYIYSELSIKSDVQFAIVDWNNFRGFYRTKTNTLFPKESLFSSFILRTHQWGCYHRDLNAKVSIGKNLLNRLKHRYTRKHWYSFQVSTNRLLTR